MSDIAKDLIDGFTELTDDLEADRPVKVTTWIDMANLPESLDTHEKAVREVLRLEQAVAEEREACAKLCEQMGDLPDGSSEGYEGGCAAAIRARGTP